MRALKKKMVIELIIYIVLVVIGVIMLFAYKPRERIIIVPQDFQVEQEGGVRDASIPNE
ncbi:hypothetical protein SAMN05446037_10542 [Anaerovirgula multivorans]|uniref:Uncharacterized protein n=1 Tax=Anaerovirgula multivorans TaxID=312168 RepID=A0A239KU27_9FIRM|nr:hypothetical protein [Anaerovirgula multivorans]SNT21575.1 hypothetical protein SAMN05446037_10542 [Anaerovirgula multivorans]